MDAQQPAFGPSLPAETFAALLADPRGGWPCRSWALLDVREHGAFEAGHVPGATALPRRRLEFRLAALVPARTTPIVVYDDGAGDGRAALAARTIRALGYGPVSVLEGGIAGWQALGGVPARGVNVPCKAFGERVLDEDGVAYVTADMLAERCAAGDRLAICDVRTQEEFAAAHLPGAGTTPGFELALHLADLEQAYETVVVNCAGRTRSIIATATLAQLGAKAAVALENGTMGWRLSGRELEKGAGSPAPPASAESRAAAAAKAQVLAREAGVRFSAPAAVAVLLFQDAPGAYVLDVRDGAAFAAGHMAGAVFAPGGQAVQRADDFVAVPGAAVIFVDDGDARAPLAAYWYRRMGFAEVHVLEGGMPAWRASGRIEAAGRGHAEPLGLEAARAGVAFVGAGALHRRLTGAPDLRPLVIDVGSSRDLKSGHIAGALWVPRGDLEARIAACLGEARGRHRGLVLVAREEAQSVFAARALAGLEILQVEVLAGGVGAWRAEGLPLVEGLPEGARTDDVVEPPYQGGLAAMRGYLEWEIALHGDRSGGEQTALHSQPRAPKAPDGA